MDLNEHGNIDPAQCQFRETCPHVMDCVTEFIVELARKDWLKGQDDLKGDEDADDSGN